MQVTIISLEKASAITRFYPSPSSLIQAYSVQCTVGRCRKLWENFLEICSKNKSLVGYTWKELRLNLEAIELKNIYGLNPMAKEFIPRVLSVSHETIPRKTEGLVSIKTESYLSRGPTSAQCKLKNALVIKNPAGSSVRIFVRPFYYVYS